MSRGIPGEANSNYKHGLSKHPLHNVWRGMLSRCKYHKDYAGRGITVCDEWQEFLPFYEWAMANGYKHGIGRKKQSLDRIDNNKGYSPDNCRFTDARTQARNTRKCRAIRAVGEDGYTLHFKSTTFACDFLKKKHSAAAPNITACLKGRIKKAYGYKWEYEDTTEL